MNIQTKTNALPYHSVKTTYGRMYELMRLTGQKMTSFDTKSTLNTLYNIFPNEIPKDIPNVKYYGIGINGQFSLNQRAKTAAYPVTNRNLNLFKQIPFRTVHIEEDLSADERELYRLRNVETYLNEPYACYYLKKSDISNQVLLQTTDTNGKPVDYKPDYSYLRPKPIEGVINGTIDDISSEVLISLGMVFGLKGDELLEVIGVLFEGDLLEAVVSELGLYTGEDKLITFKASDGSLVEMNEAIGVQLYMHNTFIGIPLLTNDARVDLGIDLISGDLTVK